MRYVLLGGVLAVGLAGCGVLNLGKDLQQAKQELQVIEGRVINRAAFNDESAGTVFAVLLDDAPQPAVVGFRVVAGAEPVRFLSEQAPRQLLAFVDHNGDFQLDADEPRVWLKQPQRQALGKPAPSAVNELVITPDALAEAPAVDLKLERLKAHNPRLKNNYLAQVTLNDARFDAAITQQGMWQPLQFLRETGHGLYLLEPWDPKRVPVLLVHGINDSPRTWAALLPAIDRRQFQVVLYHYPSSWQISSNASLLAQAWQDAQLRLGFQRFHLLAHSMGGLLARDFVRQLSAQQASVMGLCQFISLSTPWAGHAAAQQGLEHSPVVAPVWRNLAPNSDFLQALWRFEWPQQVPHTLIASYAGDSVFVAGKSDGVVSLASQLHWPAQEQASEIRLIEATHTGVLTHGQTHAVVRRQLAADCVAR
ncbi:alpha/beta fold hydrolase [Atopomonas sediminilitoris]|uniref:alpha/beta fold hydrolase n=1 Tax=Atopomonas sediminilitoris TaxID=2919919 RepID=UPI001F4DD617|nr:alpha/beta fold hydrolase [Atopomonas sediminilitoris]MCJ8168309.1 alpha/beta fold hydrolase [Atopomonas sediminilitoris]